MKRVLLASTALGMSAGVAFAQDGMMEMASPISLSGDARMGITSHDNSGADNPDGIRFSSRVRLKVSVAKELDSGLSMSGEFWAHEAVKASSGTKGHIALSGPFGKLAMGSLDSAAKAAVGQVDGAGFTGLGDPNEIAYIRGTDPEDPMLLYTLPKMGMVQAYVSLGQHDDPDDEDGKEIAADTAALGAKADLTIGEGTAWVAAGYESSVSEGEDGQLAIGAGVSAVGFTAKIVGSSQGMDEGEDVERFGVSLGYSAGGMGANVFFNDNSDVSEAFGAGVSFGLGGGASLKAGITTESFDAEGVESDRRADLGVTFAF